MLDLTLVNAQGTYGLSPPDRTERRRRTVPRGRAYHEVSLYRTGVLVGLDVHRQFAPRHARMILGTAAVGLSGALFGFVPVARNAPGLSFRVSSAVRIYPGDTPRAQDDEVMRGRGVALNDRSRIEFLAYTPLPQNLTT